MIFKLELVNCGELAFLQQNTNWSHETMNVLTEPFNNHTKQRVSHVPMSEVPLNTTPGEFTLHCSDINKENALEKCRRNHMQHNLLYFVYISKLHTHLLNLKPY